MITIKMMTKSMPFLAISLATRLSLAADVIATESLTTPVNNCTGDQWLLIEVDGNGKQIQSQCVDVAICPAGTAATQFDLGKGWVVCQPCLDSSSCNRGIPL